MECFEKEYLIKKISDQKGKDNGEYEYFRTIKIGEDNLPLSCELSKLRNIEFGKNVAFFIGDNNISLISYQNEYKFRANCKKEYKKYWDDDNLKKVVMSTFWKDVKMLSKVIPNIRLLNYSDSSNDKPPVKRKK